MGRRIREISGKITSKTYFQQCADIFQVGSMNHCMAMFTYMYVCGCGYRRGKQWGGKKLQSKKESTEKSYIFPENSITQMSFV